MCLYVQYRSDVRYNANAFERRLKFTHGQTCSHAVANVFTRGRQTHLHREANAFTRVGVYKRR